jgi:hypothetical protein
MSNLIPRLALATLFLLVVFGYGWMHRHDGNTETPAQTVRRVQHATATTYTVPDCGKDWPPSCPDSHTKEVPACSRIWPTTCRTK